MRTSRRKKSAVTDFPSSPPSPTRSMTDSPPPPMKFAFNLNSFNTTTTTKKNSSDIKTKTTTAASVPMHPTGPSSPLNNPTSISDLKDLASARLESVKRQFDRSHSDFLKDVEAFQSRLHKRLKIQTQACQQGMDEAEKEYRKMTERISESQEAMKASYMEFIAEAQDSASRVCKTSIPELAQSFEKSIESLRSRYCSATTLG